MESLILTGKRPWPRPPVLTLAAAAVVTAVAHLSFLGWHHLQDFETWKVTTYGVILAAVVAGGTWIRIGVDAAVVVTLAATALWCADAATDNPGGGSDGLWPVGGFMVLVCAALGSAFVVGLATAARSVQDRSAGRTR